MKVKTYMIAVYAVLVKNGKREIEELPEAYIIPVAGVWRQQFRRLSGDLRRFGGKWFFTGLYGSGENGAYGGRAV